VTLIAKNNDHETQMNITINIGQSPPGFSNTLSVFIPNNTWLICPNTVIDNLFPLYRLADGQGASDSWSVSFWFKCDYL